MEALRHRAPLFLRANVARASRDEVAARLAAEGVDTRPSGLAKTALEVTTNGRRVAGTRAFAEGLVEVQDAASQAVVAGFAAALPPATRVLDFCAGGGGKALALAALGLAVSAHDADPGRMRDLPARAARAGTPVALLDRPGPGWPAVLADVPCSGSGSWRRAPEGKWALTPDRLAALQAMQDRILDRCAALVAPGGLLGYATCSLLDAENDARSTAFLDRHPGWHRRARHCWTPLDGGDGFYMALVQRN
jgi:16S rRNA (cytosine967-C5)-methyltransferase